MNMLARVLSGLTGVKAAARTPNTRLPLSRHGSGMGVFVNGTIETLEAFIRGGGKNLPIKPEEAGDLRLNSIVAICLNWIGTSWPLAIPQVGRLRSGKFTPDKAHPLVDLLQKPHPHYGGKWLMWALNTDYWTLGNAYVQILTGRGGVPVELNYVPAKHLRPVADDAGFLSHYYHEVSNKEVDPQEIVHFRFGIHPDNPLLGQTPLLAVFREIVTDNSAADYNAGLLKNGGVPPWLLSPRVTKDLDGQVVVSPEEAKTVRDTIQERTGQRPGQGLFISSAIDFHQLAFEPGKMGLELLREEPETRIPAVFGIPPIVLGLRAGLLRSTYNNTKEAKSAAWTGCVIPTQDYFAEEITNHVLVRYPDGAEKVLQYDRSQIGELQPDQNERRKQAREDFGASVITLEEARAEGGRQTDDKVRAQIETERPKPPPVDPAAGNDPNAEDPKKPPTPAKKHRQFRWETKEASNTSVATVSTPELQATLEAFLLDLADREAQAVVAMRSSFEVARAAIQERLDALEERMQAAATAGEPMGASWPFQERRYLELIHQVDTSLRELASDTAGPLRDAQEDYLALAREHAETLAKAALGPLPEGAPAGASVTWNRLPKEALTNLVGYASDGSPLRQVLAEIAPDAVEAVRETLVGGLAAGENPRTIARNLRAVVDGQEARCLTLARTETLRAYREASAQQFQANQDVVDGWIWTASLSGETCPCCWAMSGTFHSLAEKLDDHPNGRCVAVPRTKSWGELLGDDTLPDTRPAVESGSDLFAKLSVDEQREILGGGLYNLYSAGKIALADTVVQTQNARWGSMRRAATIQEALANAGAR